MAKRGFYYETIWPNVRDRNRSVCYTSRRCACGIDLRWRLEFGFCDATWRMRSELQLWHQHRQWNCKSPQSREIHRQGDDKRPGTCVRYGSGQVCSRLWQADEDFRTGYVERSLRKRQLFRILDGAEILMFRQAFVCKSRLSRGGAVRTARARRKNIEGLGTSIQCRDHLFRRRRTPFARLVAREDKFQQREIFDAAARYGIRYGFTVPIHRSTCR